MIDTGVTIAGYRTERLLGSGGMGSVYAATQLSLGRVVALKVLSPKYGEDPDFRERFRREAMLQAALDHPGIVPVYEAGESPEGMFIAMRLVDGTDLRRLGEQGIEPDRALGLLAQVASALDAAHAAGLVHRDVKPQNILVEGDRAYLSDFGLTHGARERGTTPSGHYLGSLDYTPPEQLRGEPVGPAGDVYALTAVLVEVLTGDVPFPYESEAEILEGHLTGRPPLPSERRPDLPEALDEVVAHGLAKQPEERPRSATELVGEARRALASPVTGDGRRRFSETISDPSLLRRAPAVRLPPERRIPWRPLALGAGCALLVGALGFALGRLSSDAESAPAGVVQGPVSVRFDDADWTNAAPPAIAGLTLEGPVALRSTHADRPGTLVVGLAPKAQGVGLLPRELAAGLRGSVAVRRVRVGAYTGLFYDALPTTKVRSRLDLLLVPTPRGAATVACLTPRVLASGTEPADCEAVMATLRLNGLRALAVSPGSAYGEALAAVLARLDGERLALRRQLAGARTRPEQARIAGGLAAAYATSAARVHELAYSPFARPSHLALEAALRLAARRHATLSEAARAGDEAAYGRAAARVESAEKNVEAGIRRLERLSPP